MSLSVDKAIERLQSIGLAKYQPVMCAYINSG
jgi:hypothetical protein